MCKYRKEAYKFISNLGDIKAILLTHSHEDHVGGAYLYNEAGFQVYAPEKSIKMLKNPPSIPEYRKLVWGQPKPVNAKPLKRNKNLIQTILKTTIIIIFCPRNVSEKINEAFYVNISIF